MEGDLALQTRQGLNFTFTGVADAAPGTTSDRLTQVLVTAKDANGRPWDCLTGRRIKGPWERWANTELARLGLATRLKFRNGADGLELFQKPGTPAAD